LRKNLGNRVELRSEDYRQVLVTLY